MQKLNKIIITAPSLDTRENVSGVSSVVSFIIENNKGQQYIHFTIGKKDNEKGKIFRRYIRTIKTYKAWKKLLLKESEAIIHYSFPLDAKSVVRDFFFIRYAVKHNRRTIVHIHGGLYLTKKRRPWIINMLLKKIFSWDIQFVVLSDSEEKKLKNEFNAKRIKILPNCIDIKDAILFKRKYKDMNEPLVIGYLGRIEENKGMDWLLLACNRLLRENIQFKLFLAGKDGGNYIEKFSDYAGTSLNYAGIVSGNEKNQFLRSLDVFVLPSYFEGLPIALLECMSYGVVPVTTPVGSIPEVVRNGENGIIIKVRDEISIADAIKLLNTNREELYRMSVNAKNTIIMRFSPEQYIETLNALYSTI